MTTVDPSTGSEPGFTGRKDLRAGGTNLERLDRLSRLLDSRFRLPILGLPVGWDSILGLVPGLGALVTLGPGIAMIAEGYRLGVPRRVLLRMAGNTGVDIALGSVPVIGDIFDVLFKSHRRNIKLLKRAAAQGGAVDPSMQTPS